MSPFWLLVLAHVISDFPLQTDKIYKIKKDHVWGIFLHVSICTITNIVFLQPYLNYWQSWIVIFFLFVVHAIVDRCKIELTARWFNDGFFYFVADQIMHITSIWLGSAIFFDWNKLQPTLNLFPHFFQNTALIIILSGIIFAVFGGGPIDYYVLVFYEKLRSNPGRMIIPFPTFVHRIPGYLERFLATYVIIQGGFYFLFLPFALLPRFLVKHKKSERGSIIFCSFMSIVLCVIIGISVRFLVNTKSF